MIFIPSAKILNISIILMMMIIFFNYSSAEPNKLFQYVVADDKDYDDYFKRNNEGINEEKLTIFEFYITKYNLEVEQILLSISNESLESKMERITNYCKPANEYRDPVVETEEYCLKIYRDLFQDLMICLTSICTDKEAWSYRLYNFFGMQSLVNNGTSPLTSTQERVTTVPNIIRITLKNALNNQDEMAAATPQKQDEKADTTPRLKGLSLWSGFNSQELNEEIIDKIGNKLSPCDQNAFYRCIMEFKNAMIVFNTKITRKYKKELITLEEKTNYDQPAFSNDEKKKILEYQEIALLKLLSLSSDSTIEPTLIKFLFPILTNHELENPIQKSYQKDCKFFLSFNLKSGVSVQNGYAAHIKSNGQYELSKYTIWMDDKYVMQIDKCRAIEEDYKLYALRLFYLGCIPLEKSLWWKELKSVQQLYPNIEDK